MTSNNKDPKIQGSTTLLAPSRIRNCRIAPTPRNNPPDKPATSNKTLLFDLILYLSGNRFNVVARYFNKDGRSFDDDSETMYMINCTFAKSDTTYDVFSPNLHAQDIHAFADILWLFPFNPIGKLRINPWVTASGLARSVTPDTGPFRITPAQYVGVLRSVQPTTIIANFDAVNNPKFKKSRPLPSNDTYVQVSGYLSHVDNSNAFHIDIDEICFLGRPELPTNKSPAKKQRVDGTTGTKGKKRQRDEWDDSDSDNTLDSTDITARDDTSSSAFSFPSSKSTANPTASPVASTSTQVPAAHAAPTPHSSTTARRTN